MTRISLSVPDKLYRRAQKRFGKDVRPAMEALLARGIEDVTEGYTIDKALEESLLAALERPSVTVDDTYWEEKIRHVKRVATRARKARSA